MTFWATSCCVAGFVINIVFYFLALALSWGFSEGLPQQAHHSSFPFVAAVILTLPIILIGIGVVIICVCSNTKTERGESVGMCGVCFWVAAFLLGGLCSLVGGIFLFVATTRPPPPKDYHDPQGYIAFAAIAGITAVCSGIAHTFGLCGYGIKNFFEEKKPHNDT